MSTANVDGATARLGEDLSLLDDETLTLALRARGWNHPEVLVAHRHDRDLLAMFRRSGDYDRRRARRAPSGGATPASLRWAVFRRDGYRCVDCGCDVDLTADHVVARANGGVTTPENLVTRCRPCNSRKGAR